MLFGASIILLALCALCCAFSAAMLLIWRFFAPALPMLLWGCAMFSFAIGSFLADIRDYIPSFFSIVVGNFLVVSCYCLVWWGVSLHREQTPFHRTIRVSLFLLAVFLTWVLIVKPDMAWRVFVLRSFIIFYLFGAIVSLLKGGHNKLARMEKVVVTALLINVFSCIFTTVIQLSGISYREPLQNDRVIALTLLLELIGVSVWGVAVILMKLEKTVDSMKIAESTSHNAKHLLETIIDHIPSMIYLKDRDGCLLACNIRLANMLGVSRGDVVGKTSHDFFPPIIADRQQADDRIVLESGDTLVRDEVIELPGGTHLFETTKLAVRNQDGEITYLCGITTDATEQRQIEMSLRESQKLFDTVANTSPALIWMSGLDKGCTWFNETWLNFTGRDMLQELGDGWAEGVHPDDVDRCFKVYSESFDSRRPFAMEYRLRRHDGEYRWLLDQGQPRCDPSGNFCGYIGSCLDITERNMANEMLKRKNDEIEQFIYSISHDLRSPLVTVKSFLGYLEQDMKIADLTRIDQDLSYIHAAADKMELLLKELLEMSRIGRQENPPERVMFQELVIEALSSVAGPIVDLKVDVHVTDVDQPMRGDRPRLAQIWQNLLDNAVKYMGDQQNPRVELGVGRRNGDVVFYVKDNGMGIAPEYRDRIFGMFAKLDQGSSGVGLGLAMVKRIVERYNGKIWVESVGIGFGSCFNFTLPEALLPEGEQ